MRPIVQLLCGAMLLAVPATAAAPPFSTSAPIAYMVDLSSGAVLYAKDADRRIPPASMAKMMTMYVAFDMIARGKVKLEQLYTVRPETWQRWHGPQAGSTMFLSAGEQVSVENLLHGISTLSGNDACVVLAEGMFGTEDAFVARMNEAARLLGLKNSRFGTSNGWPDGGGTYTTARDLALIGRATIERFPALYKQFYGKRDFTWGRTLGSGQAITQPNRNPLLGKVPGADGIKTGHTEEAGFGFAGSAEEKGRRIVMVVAGLDSFDARARESVRFMEWGQKAWEAKPLLKAGVEIETADVQMGTASDVPLVTPRNVAVTMPTGTNGRIEAKVVYDGPIRAPIRKGQHVADLVIATPYTPPQVTPLVAGEDIGKAGFFGRIWSGFTSLF